MPIHDVIDWEQYWLLFVDGSSQDSFPFTFPSPQNCWGWHTLPSSTLPSQSSSSWLQISFPGRIAPTHSPQLSVWVSPGLHWALQLPFWHAKLNWSFTQPHWEEQYPNKSLEPVLLPWQEFVDCEQNWLLFVEGSSHCSFKVTLPSPQNCWGTQTLFSSTKPLQLLSLLSQISEEGSIFPVHCPYESHLHW